MLELNLSVGTYFNRATSELSGTYSLVGYTSPVTGSGNVGGSPTGVCLVDEGQVIPAFVYFLPKVLQVADLPTGLD